MKIIIGLGNPEEKYSGTRHNIGFEIVNLIQKEWGFPEFELSKKFNAEISTGDFLMSLRAQRSNPAIKETEIGIAASPVAPRNDKVIIVKPQTFINLSGEAVQKILDFYKLTPEDIIVIHDDLDIALGKLKIATDSSSAGHNGVQNIIETLGTQKFKRVRVGIGEEVSGAPICPPRASLAESRRVDEQSPPASPSLGGRVEESRTDAHDFVLGKFSEEELEKIKKISDDILSAVKSLL